MRKKDQNEPLAVILDEKSRREYYVSIIDTFRYRDHDYSVMYNYRPDVGRASEPEVVVMRSYTDSDGVQHFASIRNPRELRIVFELFYQRYREMMQSN